MALLNFAKTYAEISSFLTATESSTGDYVKLFFSKDGHIITHGKDFLASPDNDAKKILRGNTTWAAITTSDLPIAANTSTFNANTIFTTLQIQLYVSQLFSANDAMRYKGTITKTSDGYTHNTTGTETAGFPTTCEVGDTYRVTTEGTYAGHECSAGDLLICIKDGTGNNLNSNTYWTAVEANINGEVLHHVNGTSIYTYSSSHNTFTIFAPTTAGTQGQVLLSNGSSAPVWANQNTLKVAEASKVTHALSTGAGLSFGSNVTFDGSADRTIKLIPATATSIGGVIIDKDSTNKTISVTNAGSIYLTKLNVINALGFTPGNAADAKSYSVILAESASATAAKNSANPFINLILTVGSTKTVEGSIQVIGSGNVTVTGTTSITIGLNAATAANYGGIKIGYTTNGRNYAVLLDDGKAYVNVPWPGLATATTDGLVPKFDAVGTGAIAADSWVLAKLSNGTYDWFQLPSSVFGDNWRPITVGGVSIGNKKLNFKPDGNISLIVDLDTTDDVYDLSFGLCWCNISTDPPTYEYA